MYDRLNWDFIEDTLIDLEILRSIRQLIMHCICSSSLQVLWNGSMTNSFIQSRGIRQADPLSPYIFVLCMERLAQAISLEVNNRRWRPIKLAKDGPTLSHLFFADDLVLFKEASLEQKEVIKGVLLKFCSASG